MRDAIIIGGGPAGLAAANYLLRKRLDILVVSENLGGKSASTVSIPNTRGFRVIKPKEIIESFRNNLEYLTHLYTLTHADALSHDDGVFAVTIRDEKGKKTERCKVVIIATGTTQRSLDVPGEREYLGKGLGYSSISYSHLLVDKRVFLVGDSQRTVDDARELANQAEEVVLLLQRGSRYREIFEEQLKTVSNIRVLPDAQVVAFQGDEFARRAVLRTEAGEDETIEADAFFVQLQPRPNSDLARDLISTDEEERIIVDMRNRTTLPGLLAAGDVTNVGFEQILIALGEGSKAALTAYQLLSQSEL